MRFRGLWIALGLTAAVAAGATVIYKWVDADGVVHYSDQEVPGAEKLNISPGSSNGIGGTTRSQPQPPAPKPLKNLRFSLFAIESPVKEQVFFGDEVVPVRLGLEPGLQPQQQITWNLNGSPLPDTGPTAVSFVLPAQPRGTYVLTATVTDAGTGESQTTDAVTFYVRQPSDLDPLRRK